MTRIKSVNKMDKKSKIIERNQSKPPIPKAKQAMRKKRAF